MIVTAPDDCRFPDTDEMTLEAFLSGLADYLEAWVPRLPPEWPDRGLYCGLMLRLRGPVLERLIGTRTRAPLTVPRRPVTVKPGPWVDLKAFAAQMRATTANVVDDVTRDVPTAHRASPTARRPPRGGGPACVGCGEAMREPTPEGLCGFCLSEARV